ncbi:hypothetical protein BBJ28_00004113 [Nothophytophthora sp. Chile5]|nr:hypothetical protein BBJ28_00004113 [Nothophytophthora sp. Chile5]
MSLAAFAFLECHPWPRAIQAAQEAENEYADVLKSKTKQQYVLDDEPRDQREAEEDTLLTRSACGSCPASASTSASASPTASQGPETSQAAAFRQVWPLLGCQWALAALSFGLLPSTMPYVYKKFAVRCCPTEDAESVTAQFQTTASIAALILGPIACLLTSYVAYTEFKAEKLKLPTDGGGPCL